MKDCGDILRQAAQDHASRVAASCGQEQQTYAALFARSCRLANALTGLGCVPGDRIAILGVNSARTVEQISGVALGGFVRAALYGHQSAAVNASLAADVGARVLIVDQALADGMLEHRDAIASLEHVVVCGGRTEEGVHDYEQLLASAATDDPGVRTLPGDIHVIRFSAGTTGRPKGIVHTVEGWLRSGDEYRWVTPRLMVGDIYLCVGQLTHAASVFFWPFLAVGAQIALQTAFEPRAFLEEIERRRATFTLVVPTMIQDLLAVPDANDRDLSSLRCVNYAASPISETTVARAIELFGDGVMHQMYAQSEAWPITMLLPEEHRARPRSVGRPTPNVRLTIVDDDGNAVPRGQIGEIAVDSPASMLEIWNDPEATAARTLPDGSVRTRDMGYVDEDGYVFIADRKDDMIISGGYNIWPAQLKNAIAKHPGVREVCVVGVPHARWGETPVAVVVPEDSGAPTETAVIELTRAQVGSVQKVTAVRFAEALPKTGVGKVARNVVREQFWSDRDERIGDV